MSHPVKARMEHETGGHRMNYQVHPPEGVDQEIRERNTDVKDLLEQAKLALVEMQGEESGVARLFVERGYSDEFSNWIAAEAKARETTL